MCGSLACIIFDGTVTEHGDGFSLPTIDPTDDMDMRDIVLTSVPVVDGLDMLVGSDAAMMADSILIGGVEMEVRLRADGIGLAPFFDL